MWAGSQVQNRVWHLMDEGERIQHEITDAKERTKERKELAVRTDRIKKVGEEMKVMVDKEVEQRRQVIAEQRKLGRAAIESKRLALLEARHSDFVAKKQETAMARHEQTRAQHTMAKQAQQLAQLETELAAMMAQQASRGVSR